MIDKVLMVDTGLCTGCKICELWCSLKHIGVINSAKSRIRILKKQGNLSSFPKVCLQCPDRYCIAACPPKISALGLNMKTGAIQVETDKCIGCGKCQEACPYDAIHPLPDEKKVIICDLCAGNPECVTQCPEGVLSYAMRDGV
jgi:Fe-S-cluster-containing hydrogenase component 2